MAVAAAAAKKAHDIILLDVSEVSSFTDYFVICDGDSPPQLQAITDHVEERLREARVRPLHIEGAGSTWILMDYGDVIVHVFQPESRRHYGLENLWLDAPRIEIETDTADLGRQDKRSVHP